MVTKPVTSRAVPETARGGIGTNERRTSIAAHYVRTVAVTMAWHEMQTISNVLGLALEADRANAYDSQISLTGEQRDAADEFIRALVELGE